MKKLIITSLLIFCFYKSKAQTDTTKADTLKIVYCQLLGISKPFTTKLYITVDYGQEFKWYKGRAAIKDENGKVKEFNSMVDGLNYMSGLGWEFVQAYAFSTGNQNVYHYLLKKLQ